MEMILDPEIKTIIDQLEEVARKSISDQKDALELAFDLKIFSRCHFSLIGDEVEKNDYYSSMERRVLIKYAMGIIDQCNYMQLVQNN